MVFTDRLERSFESSLEATSEGVQETFSHRWYGGDGVEGELPSAMTQRAVLKGRQGQGCERAQARLSVSLHSESVGTLWCSPSPSHRAARPAGAPVLELCLWGGRSLTVDSDTPGAVLGLGDHCVPSGVGVPPCRAVYAIGVRTLDDSWVRHSCLRTERLCSD